jgi:hypothetical protein
VSIENKLGVNRGLIPFVLEGGHSPTMLRALELPVHEKQAVATCLDCGEVHTMHKSCQSKRRVRNRHRKVADVHEAEDVKILDDIVKANGYGSWTGFCRELVLLYKESGSVGIWIGTD